MRKSSSAFLIFFVFYSAKQNPLWYNEFYETLRKEPKPMSYRVVVKCGGGAFFVPNEAVENLKIETAAHLRVLLLSLSKGFGETSPEDIAAGLGILPADAKELLDYWVARGILECDGVSAPSPAPEAKKVPSCSETSVSVKEVPKPPETKLTMKEVLRLKNEDEGIAHVLSEAERILGKTFTTSDTETIVWLISYAGISPEVLITVIAYCAGIGKNNLRYIQKTALEWLDSGIETIEAAEERIHALNEARSWEGEVKRVLEIYGRSLVSKEKEFCESWRLYNISPELIHFAYEKCIEKTAKLSFPYINKILLSWHQKGIKTVAEASAENKPRADENKPSFDLDDLERRMMLDDSVI